VILAVGRFVLGLPDLGAVRGWYFWQFQRGLGEFVSESALVVGARVVKGQATAWLFGAQTLVDAAKHPALLASPRALAFSLLTLAAFGAAGALFRGLWR
jgi:hypothetical protein